MTTYFDMGKNLKTKTMNIPFPTSEDIKLRETLKRMEREMWEEVAKTYGFIFIKEEKEENQNG